MKRLIGAAGVLVPAAAALFVVAGPAQAASSVFYANCTQARAAGASNIRQGQPGYRSALDRDHDGIACEASDESATSSSSGSSTTSRGQAGTIIVNSGSGGRADRASIALPAAVGGLGVLVLGASTATAARRRWVTVRR